MSLCAQVVASGQNQTRNQPDSAAVSQRAAASQQWAPGGDAGGRLESGWGRGEHAGEGLGAQPVRTCTWLGAPSSESTRDSDTRAPRGAWAAPATAMPLRVTWCLPSLHHWESAMPSCQPPPEPPRCLLWAGAMDVFLTAPAPRHRPGNKACALSRGRAHWLRSCSWSSWPGPREGPFQQAQTRGPPPPDKAAFQGARSRPPRIQFTDSNCPPHPQPTATHSCSGSLSCTKPPRVVSEIFLDSPPS